MEFIFFVQQRELAEAQEALQKEIDQAADEDDGEGECGEVPVVEPAAEQQAEEPAVEQAAE